MSTLRLAEIGMLALLQTDSNAFGAEYVHQASCILCLCLATKAFMCSTKKKGVYKGKVLQSKKKRWNARHPQGEGKGWGGKVCLWKEGLSFALDYHVNAEGLHHALGFLLYQKHVPRIRLLRQDLQALKQLVGDEHSFGRRMILVQEIDEAQDR